MKNNSLLIGVAALLSFKLAISTDVIVDNNTLFTFSASFEQTDEKDKPGSLIEGEQWKLFNNTVKPLQDTKLIMFNREKGLKNNYTYNFKIELTCSDPTLKIALFQKLETGKRKSTLSWSASYQMPGKKFSIGGGVELDWMPHKFYTNSDESWHNPIHITIKDSKGKEHNLFIRSKTIKGGHLVYEIGERRKHQTYKIENSQGDPNKINILNFNTFLLDLEVDLKFLPTFSVKMKEGMDARAKLIPQHLKGYDVLVLQEMFWDKVRDDILLSLKKAGYINSTSICGAGFGWKENKNRWKFDEPLNQPIINFNDPRFGKDELYTKGWEGDPAKPGSITARADGGAIIVSKWPIKEAKEIIFGTTSGDDKWAKKGVVYAKIDKEGRIYHIFGSHTAGRDVRPEQFKVMKKFIDAQKIPKDELVIIAGDLNVDVHEKTTPMPNVLKVPEVEYMLKTVHAALPPLKGNEKYSVNTAKNLLVEPDQEMKLVDYVMYSTDYAKPIKSYNEIRPITSPQAWDKDKLIHDLSDHYGMYGYFEIQPKRTKK